MPSPRPVGDGIPADSLVFSCAEAAIAAETSFAGAGTLFKAMRERISTRTRALEILFPLFSYRRPRPSCLRGSDAEGLAGIARELERLDRTYTASPATILCESRDIRLGADVLFYREDGALRVLYETCRLTERHVVEALGLDADRVDEGLDDDGVYLHLGSAGSFNYGHWLVDDLPRLEAFFHLRRLHPGQTVTILLPSYNVLIDEVRRRMVEIYLGRRANIRTVFLARDRVYGLARLYHVTPCSHEPFAKSPEAVAAMRTRLLRNTRFARAEAALRRAMSGRPAAGRCLFVDRAEARGRTLVNRSEILPALVRRGFDVIDPEQLSPRQQIVRFARARLVVGIIGAAMTNTAFCPAGTRVIHLAPDTGWTDPFFWDLAAVCGHRYGAVYGRWSDLDSVESRRNFSVPLGEIEAALDTP